VKLATLIVVAFSAMGAGIFFGTQQRSPDLSTLSGFSYPVPEKLQSVDLIDQNNGPLTEEHFKNRWTFIYVGYTFCPDACPLSLNVLNQTAQLLDKEELPTAHTLFVSVDPERDTPERLKDYTEYFNNNFRGATGTPEKIKQFADQVSALYSVPDDRSDPNYLVDHSSSIILINPNASVQAIFTPPQSAESLAKDFALLVRHFETS